MANINKDPLFTGKPKIGKGTWTASLNANTNSDGTGNITSTPTMLLIFTADATYGSFVQKIRLTANGSTASTTTTATVGRVYVSTISSGATTNADTRRFDEVALPAQ